MKYMGARHSPNFYFYRKLFQAYHALIIRTYSIHIKFRRRLGERNRTRRRLCRCRRQRAIVFGFAVSVSFVNFPENYVPVLFENFSQKILLQFLIVNFPRKFCSGFRRKFFFFFFRKFCSGFRRKFFSRKFCSGFRRKFFPENSAPVLIIMGVLIRIVQFLSLPKKNYHIQT